MWNTDRPDLTPRQMNRAITALNCRETPEQAGLTPEETVWYRAFLAEAEEMERKYGERPVFDLCELD